MFTPEDRTRLRDALVAAAHADPRITGCALTGSTAAGAEDRWSDIDLALAVAARADSGRSSPTGPTACTARAGPSTTWTATRLLEATQSRHG
jgi:hypothetical protein